MQQRIPPPAEPAQPPPTIELPKPAAPAPAAPVRFVLSGVVIEGATAFPTAALTPLYEDYLAREIDLDDVQRILAAITAKYRAEGYFLSRAIALPQPLEQGLLRITVVEGYVERVSFADVPTDVQKRLAPYLAALPLARPLKLAELERALLLVNDLPGVHVTAKLATIDEHSGAYDLVLGVADRRFSGFASFDNRGTRSLGPWQLQLSGGVNSAITAFDRLAVSVFSTINQPDELLSTELLYDAPVGTAGTRLTLSFVRTHLQPGGSLAPSAIDGTAMRYIARISHPLLRTREQSLWLGAGLDWLDSTESANDALLFDDHLRVVRSSAIYTLADGGNTNTAYLEASQGLGVLGASPAGAANLSRANGRGEFTKLTGSLTRQQVLSGPWGAQIALAGQKAAQPLLLAEQFSLGGVRFGRAYDPAEITGDDALAGSFELRYGRSVDSRLLSSYQFYGFYDLGVVWNMDVNDGTQRQSLASTGVGVRLGLPQSIAASLEVARPLTRRVALEGDKPVRVFVSLSAPF